MRRRLLALAVVLLMVAGACGDDGGTASDDPPSNDPSQPSDTSQPEGEPVSGGELTVLFPSERPSFDPVTSQVSSGSTSLGDFAVYGGLVLYEAATQEIVPLLAESLESNDTLDVWTLTLRPGITFTDGTPLTAEAVKINWERHGDPANRSSSFPTVSQIAAMNVVDDLTLEVRLSGPNSLFDYNLSRSSINLIASAEALQSGHDLTSEPIGAGPFKLESWVRDDRQIYVRNPDWFDAPRPYLDRLVIRVIRDENQTLDTFLTGGADAMFATVESIIAQGEEAGASYQGQNLGPVQFIAMSNAHPPFDDLRMRQFVAMGVDWQALIEVIDSSDAQPATNLTGEKDPWYTEDAALPEYDSAAAQALLDEYVAEHGEVETSCLSGQAGRSIAQCEFLQTALNQYDGINVKVETVDTPTSYQRALGSEFDLNVWGGPIVEPGVDLHRLVYSKAFTNTARYSNPGVDALFEEVLATGDPEERYDLYKQIYALVAADLPFRPISHARFGHLLAEHVRGGHHYNDGALRTDLLWLEK